MKVSVLIPVYNEEPTLRLLLDRILALPLDLEVVAVDDGSGDGSWECLEAVRDPRVRRFRHAVNRGKGAAVKTALAEARGEIVLIQDADLEYDPGDYPRLIEPIERGAATVVYGVRFGPGQDGASGWLHRLGNRVLTGAANLLFHARLTDMETCYKVFRKDALDGTELRSEGFGFDPEITASFLRRGERIVEVPVSYRPRSRSEGKKIRARDGIVVLLTLLRCRFGGGGKQR